MAKITTYFNHSLVKMERYLLKSLVEWQNNPTRKPLLLRGARQVGKTHLVRQLGKGYFDNIIEINFELEPTYKSCFKSLEPSNILNEIKSIGRHTITPGKSLLFIDEIQEEPRAIEALRYFYEKMPELHVIGAGSLLEFALRDANFSMPVGRVSFMYLKPLSFFEFLEAFNYNSLIKRIKASTLESPLSEVEHNKAIELSQLYSVIGGMPGVISSYMATNDINEAYYSQTEILATYRRDFGKYANQANHKYLECVFERAPYLVGEQVKYSKLNGDFRSRELSSAIKDLQDAGLLFQVYATATSGLPLKSTLNTKKFKLVFLDTGLTRNAMSITPTLSHESEFNLLNKGALAEQYTGQALLALQNARLEPELYFWSRDGSGIAEVDYVISIENQIIPIEVKSGKTGRLKSLKILMSEKNLPIGIRISNHPLQLTDNILSVPFYMVECLRNLIRTRFPINF